MIAKRIKKILFYLVEFFGYKLQKQRSIDNAVPLLFIDGLSYDDILYYRGRSVSDIPIFYIETSIITDLLCFSFSQTGWHPFTATIREYLEYDNLEYEGSILEKYYKRFTPSNLAEAFFTEITDDIAEATNIPALYMQLPWELTPRTYRGSRGLGKEHGCQSFGPVSQVKGDMEFNRVIKTFNSIKDRGFDLNESVIYGHFLKFKNKFRFIVRSGNHRVPALSILGETKIPVTLDPRVPRVIDYSSMNHWPQVRNGRMSKVLAEKIFLQYFHADGTERANKLGFVSPIKG